MIINGQALLRHAPIKDMVCSKQKVHGTSYGLSEAGYDIRIKQNIWFNPAKGNGLVALNNEPGKQGRFTLASAIEEFDMPIDLVGVVHDKSTWARQGVSVFNTVIEPGWKGFLTLEIVFQGNESVHIPAGSGIAQVLFHKLQDTAEYNGKYQNQKDEPVPSIWEG